MTPSVSPLDSSLVLADVANNPCHPLRSQGPDGGVVFEATDASLQSAAEQTGLQHVTKVWSRHAWERATPWILSQRQKLEGNGWTTGDSLRVS